MVNRHFRAIDGISVVRAISVVAFLKTAEVEGMRISAFKAVTVVFEFHCTNRNYATASDGQDNQEE